MWTRFLVSAVAVGGTVHSDGERVDKRQMWGGMGYTGSLTSRVAQTFGPAKRSPGGRWLSESHGDGRGLR